MSPPLVLFARRLSRNTVVATFPPRRHFGSAAPVQEASCQVHYHASITFAEAILLRSIGRGELLDDHRGLATVAEVVGDELSTAIGTQVLEAKTERYEVLREFDQGRLRLVFRRYKADRIDLGEVIGILGHEAVVPARRGRHRSQEVGAKELKSLRHLGLARDGANWLLDALVDLADVARCQEVGEIDSCLCDIPRSLHGELVRMPQTLVPDVQPATTMAVDGIAGVVVDGDSFGLDGRRERRSSYESTSRPHGAIVDVAINGLAVFARGVTATMVPLLRWWEARADPVGSVCPEMILARNAASV